MNILLFNINIFCLICTFWRNMHDMAVWLPFISPIEKAWHSDIFYDIMVNTYVCFPL